MDDYVVVGRINGLHGVRGWVKVFSYTEPCENILAYSPWYLRAGSEWVPREVVSGRRHGKGIVACIEGVTDRDGAARLLDTEIAVRRQQLPAADADEYYWADLEGLRVVTTEGIELGTVDHLMETGANDVLVVSGERERLIPFIRDVVLEVDLSGKTVQVAWDPDF